MTMDSISKLACVYAWLPGKVSSRSRLKRHRESWPTTVSNEGRIYGYSGTQLGSANGVTTNKTSCAKNFPISIKGERCLEMTVITAIYVISAEKIKITERAKCGVAATPPIVYHNTVKLVSNNFVAIMLSEQKGLCSSWPGHSKKAFTA